MNLFRDGEQRLPSFQRFAPRSLRLLVNSMGDAETRSRYRDVLLEYWRAHAAVLGDLQTQHSCLVLIDVTETCNLECPTCFAVSAPGMGRHAPEPAVMRTLDAAIAREGGKVDALMLSGGEPTVHPGILDLVRAATERNVTRVVLNTNGIRIARDDAFLGELAKLRDRVEICGP